MKIKQDKRVVDGTHNGVEFKYEGGSIYCYEILWSKQKIATLIEIANLLELQGFPVLKNLHKKKIVCEQIFGGRIEKEVETSDTFEEQ